MTTYTAPNIVVKLVVEECISCGVGFGMPSSFQYERQHHGENFYCPNGHPQVYSEPEEARLKRLLKNAEATATWERTNREHAERRLAATKGVVTKMRRHTLDGQCPICGTHLRDVARHVARVHPDEKAETE